MTWFRIDDDFATHPKCADLSAAAVTLWLHGLAYCSRNMTNGLIPFAMLPRLSGVSRPSKAAAELVGAGLWHATDSGWEMDRSDSPAELPITITRHGPKFQRDLTFRRRHLPAPTRRHVFERDGQQCNYCGSTERLEIDHIVPLRHGGSFLDPLNLQVLCKSCNCSKGAKLDAP